MFLYMYLHNNSEVDLRPLFAAVRLLGSSPAGINFFAHRDARIFLAAATTRMHAC